tara:strand:- start:185 stop:616 length:432 start_codon:yes stop_codon:yes gene_type:complete
MNKQNKKSPGYALIGLLVGLLIGAIFAGIAGDETGALVIICTIIGGWVGYNGFTESSILITQKAKQSSRNVKEIVKEADRRVGVKKEIKSEEDAYERAGEELEELSMNKGIWAKAFADSDGDEHKQKALYIKYRAEQLIKDIV